jgi:hypothetical protein
MGRLLFWVGQINGSGGREHFPRCAECDTSPYFFK